MYERKDLERFFAGFFSLEEVWVTATKRPPDSWYHKHPATYQAFLDQIVANQDKKDFYFGFAKMHDGRLEEERVKKHHRYKTRSASAAHNCKVLFVEFDVRPTGHNYRTFEDARAGIAKLEAERGRAAIINTGGGYHCYWVLKDAIPAKDWWAYANALKEDCERLKLICDHNRTCDLASIPRAPGSLNSKYNKHVTIEQYGDLVDVPPLRPGAKLRPSAARIVVKDTGFTKMDPEELAQACGHVGMLARGEDQGHAAWFYIASNMKELDKGEEFYLRWSERQAEINGKKYDEEEALTKLQADQITGCQAFSDLDDPENPCKTCPFAGKVRNPLVAAQRAAFTKVKDDPVRLPPLPEGFSYNGRKVIFEKVTATSPSGLQMSSAPIYVDGIIEDVETGKWHLRIRFLHHSGYYAERVIPQHRAIGRGSSIHIRENCMDVEETAWTIYGSNYLSMYLDICEETGVNPVMNMAKKIGWTFIKETGQKLFCLGHDAIGDDLHATLKYHVDPGNPRFKDLADSMRAPANPIEHLQEWQDLIHEWLEDADTPNALKLCLLASFMSPVLHLVPGKSFEAILIHLHGDGGGGKSAGLKAAASVWGTFRKYVAVSSASYAAMWSDLAQQAHVPMIIEELTDASWLRDPELLREFTKAITQGKEPPRNTSEGKSRQTGTFSTCLIAASNKSIHSLIRQGVSNNKDALAAIKRVIEFEVGPMPKKPNVNDYERFTQMGGVAGREWITHLFQPDTLERLFEHCRDYRNDNIDRADRFLFWFMCIADWTVRELRDHCMTSINRADPVNNPIPTLVVFDPKLLDWFLKTQLETQDVSSKVLKLDITQSSILDFVGLNSGKMNQFLKRPSSWKSYKPSKVHVRMDEVVLAKVISTGEYYMLPAALRTYLGQRTGQRNASAITDALVLNGTLAIRRSCIKGEASDPTEKCYVITEELLDQWRQWSGQHVQEGEVDDD